MTRGQAVHSVAIGARLPWRETLAAYHELTKPGITLMVVISAAAGFFLALPRNPGVYLTMGYAWRFIAITLGTALVSSGSCALNHVIERRFDETMKRTMHRPLPSGRLRPEHASVFGFALTAGGLVLLAAWSIPAAGLALLTWVLYLGVYTPMKRVSPLATLVGGIPGALPPLGGWVMIRGSVSVEGLLLFIVLFLWQMPHFLSLAWMYRKDYERGGFPMLTVLDDTGITVARHIVVYTALLVLFSLSLSAFHLTGGVYFAVVLVLGAGFTAAAVRFAVARTNARARAVLIASYFYLLAALTMMFIDKA